MLLEPATRRGGPAGGVFLLVLLALVLLWPASVCAGNEVLAGRAVVVMTFINGPAYFQVSEPLSDRQKIECYKREVDDMVQLGAHACALDTFNTSTNRLHVRLFARAVQEYNREHPGVNFAYFLLLDLPLAGKPSWDSAETVHACFEEIKSEDYATVDGEYVLGTWHGEQLGTAWWRGLSDLFASREGRRIFLYNNFYPTAGRTLADQQRELVRAGIKTAYYDFITANDQALDANIALEAGVRHLGVSVACGINSSFWALCSSKKNSGHYVDFDGYGWMMRYFERLLQEEPLARARHTWITIWSDFGEDNFFVPVEHPPPFARNPDIPVWTHRGYYKLLQFYMQWWSDGKAPSRSDEALYWCYRQHPKGLPTRPGDPCDESRFASTRRFLPSWNEARDAIYVVTRLQDRATLKVTLGASVHSVSCEAGVVQHRFDWNGNRGRPHFELKRAQGVVLEAEGRLEITDTPRDLKGGFTRNMHHYADYVQTTESGRLPSFPTHTRSEETSAPVTMKRAVP